MNEPCDTCLRHPAVFLAHHTSSGDVWQVCHLCRAQAIRLGITTIIHHDLPLEEHIA